jgi:hypothetical protein
MANRVYPKGNGIGNELCESEQHPRLACGCLAWSEARKDLILTWCNGHQQEIEDASAKMRRRALKRNAERTKFSNEQVAANLDRFGA